VHLSSGSPAQRAAFFWEQLYVPYLVLLPALFILTSVEFVRVNFILGISTVRLTSFGTSYGT
jgi:hypothetical protein